MSLLHGTMRYLYSTGTNYEDYSSGRVLRGFPGAPAFPVRCASELFQRAITLLNRPHCHLYDPCCGGGYSLTTITLLHSDRIASIAGSDINLDALEMARKNLRLLTREGLSERRGELEALVELYGKSSHMEALKTLFRFEERHGRDISFSLFQADLFDLTTLTPTPTPDILFCDLPYGHMTSFGGDPDYPFLLENLSRCSASDAIAIVACLRGTPLESPSWRRIFRANVGGRTVVILQKPHADPSHRC